MLRKNLMLLLLLCLPGMAVSVWSQQVKRVDPPCWWMGMQTGLQVMLYGENLQNSTVKVLEEGLSVKAVHPAESPNYLFVDLDVRQAGKYTLEISRGKKKIKVPYEIFSRRVHSAEREGFTVADVIYLIMPDRFANGDPGNDQIEGSAQRLDRKGLEDRHGGDIQGIIDHLDYLADLGVTTIWSTPMLEDTRYYHHYGVTDYYRIDPHLGTNELYKEWVARAHQKKLKVIQDVTPNHCGIDHWWINDPPFNDWINALELPSHYEFFSLESLSDVHASAVDQAFCGSTILYQAMPDMNLLNPYVLQYMTQFAIWWIEYADLDGLRVDTYFYMGKIAGEWTKNILNEYPNITLVGEIWGTQPSIIAYWVGSTENRDGFSSHLPMVMDFPLQASIVTDFSVENAHWGGKMRTIYNTIVLDFVYKNPEASQVIFADNHDTDRLYNMMGKDVDKIKLAMTLITTTRGLPQLYYGSELLFADDARGGPHKNRMDFPGGWVDDTLNLFKANYRTLPQQDVFNHVRTLLHFRKQTPVLQNGKLMHYIPLGGVYTYFRYDEKECVMIVVNASSKPQPITWERFENSLTGKETGRDILTGTIVTKNADTEVPAKTSMVVYFK
jgi:glycosidase